MTSSDFSIGMVSPDAPPHVGGMGRHVGELIRGLEAQGVRVRVFDRTKRPLLYRAGKNVGFSLGLSRALARWADEEEISLLHLHAGPGGALLSRPPRPMIVTANHTYVQQAGVPSECWKSLVVPWEARTYRAALAIACLSSDTAAALVDRYHIPRARLRVIPCGFDQAPWGAYRHTPRVPRTCVFVGRPDARKGFDLLRSAWPTVRRRFPDARLTVVGWRESAGQGIEYYGRLPDPELRNLVGFATVLVAPSRLEGFGLAAAEAIAAGTPVVATNVDGLRSVVSHGRSGLLVTVNPDAIADGIAAVFSDPQLWQRLHEGCLIDAQRFSLAEEARHYLRLYHEVYSRSACVTR